MTVAPSEVPSELTGSANNLLSITAYSVLMVIAACGNLTVFITLFRNRHRKSRVNLFIMHLSIADLVVTFIMLPLEIAWHTTVAWIAGDVACRILMFWRTFGFYLSSFILIAISLDRYFAITRPMSLSDADRRGKLMLILAWLFSIVASSPQSVIYHVESHPNHPWFKQCVTFNFFPTTTHQMIYNVFCFSALYLAPLVVIVISYSFILIEITKRSREGRGGDTNSMIASTGSLRRSGVGRMEKARIRTLKMTIVIVFVFVMCWTPYYAMIIWHWVDKTSAEQVDEKIQRILYLFAVSNSCMNPIVYGKDEFALSYL
ncbi:hypothetical protein CAPTEDRAFT_136055 [Capitella teleta]|uniref:G-protein coupled receptors family 1 profile domain-containing protein n=1 Tax=Capitella teleta TaxID=283909 RepID=R7TR44_CAPTE|nr:hypothetical protein CAPTEDRAFT_136055 [Capitella teleta]|eukprot:ELT96363.1 hypothetical protein CAPTEDRAFT_136055 [Capitella teleta]